MADRLFENYGVMNGTYAGVEFVDSQSSVLEVTLTDVSFTKTADQSVWLDGNLTITFTVDNSAGEGTLDVIVIRDTLDNTKFQYIEDSVTAQLTDAASTVTELVLGTDYTVTYTANTPDAESDLLEIAFLAGGAAESIPVGSIATISFLGSKVPA